MGSICGPGRYKTNRANFYISDEDYLGKDLIFTYKGLNSSTPLEKLLLSNKKILNINNSTSFLDPNRYYKKQVPPASSEPFEDKEFPPNQNSLLYITESDKENVTDEEIDGLKQLHWEKARTLFRTNNYVLYDTIDVDDVKQGSLGNCYFLSVLSTLASSPELYDKVFIDKEKTDNNCYRVRLLIKGIPKIVVVDDFFPADIKNGFAFAMSGRRELWVQILEKAWAKINKSYARTIAGLPSEAFSVLNEAPCVTYFHKRYTPSQLWAKLKREKAKGYYLATNTTAMTPEDEKKLGLVSGHAYSITNLYEFELPNNAPNSAHKNQPKEKQYLRLIQLRNPWSYYEWLGNFHDKSDKWNIIPNLRQKVGLINKDDGLFFMDFNDFLQYYPYTYVLNYKKNYSYNFKKVHQESSYHMSVAKIEINQEMQVKIGVHLKQERFYSKVPNYRLQAARIIIAKYIPETKKHIFVGSEFGANDVLYAELEHKLDKGTYHIFTNIYWPYDTPITYTISTYSQYPLDILEANRDEISSNYLEDILIYYLDQNVKKNVLNNTIYYQFSDVDNNTGFFMFLLTNNSNNKYIFRGTFTYFGAEMINTEYIQLREYEPKQNKLKIDYLKDTIECPLMPNERKLILWRKTKNPYECKISFIQKKLFQYKEGVFNIKNMSLYESIRNVYHELKINKINEDIEYTEVELNDKICLVFRNVTKTKKNYLIEMEFELTNLVVDEEMSDNFYFLILNCEQCSVIQLKKINPDEKFDFKFTYSYGIVSKSKN